VQLSYAFERKKIECKRFDILGTIKMIGMVTDSLSLTDGGTGLLVSERNQWPR
jgi:hypothetical protein